MWQHGVADISLGPPPLLCWAFRDALDRASVHRAQPANGPRPWLQHPLSPTILHSPRARRPATSSARLPPVRRKPRRHDSRDRDRDCIGAHRERVRRLSSSARARTLHRGRFMTALGQGLSPSTGATAPTHAVGDRALSPPTCLLTYYPQRRFVVIELEDGEWTPSTPASSNYLRQCRRRANRRPEVHAHHRDPPLRHAR